MNIRADFGKRRCWIRMGNVFAGEQRDIAISSVHILFYSADPTKCGKMSVT
jgi:hypothetical protein